MNRPTRLTLFGMCLCLALALFMKIAPAQESLRALNNLSHESTICFAYYVFTAKCFGNSTDPRDKEISTKYMAQSSEYLKVALQVGKLAGVSEKAMAARTEIAVDGMKDDMDNSCTNISVIANKYARTCKALAENTNARLESIVRVMEREQIEREKRPSPR